MPTSVGKSKRKNPPITQYRGVGLASMSTTSCRLKQIPCPTHGWKCTTFRSPPHSRICQVRMWCRCIADKTLELSHLAVQFQNGASSNLFKSISFFGAFFSTTSFNSGRDFIKVSASSFREKVRSTPSSSCTWYLIIHDVIETIFQPSTIGQEELIILQYLKNR